MEIRCTHCGCRLAVAMVEDEIRAAMRDCRKVAGSPCCGNCEADALSALQADAKRKPTAPATHDH